MTWDTCESCVPYLKEIVLIIVDMDMNEARQANSKTNQKSRNLTKPQRVLRELKLDLLYICCISADNFTAFFTVM